MLPRELGHRLGLATHAWPTWLRNKWLAAGLMVVFFWAYEQFRLWDAPLRTAWLLIGYFAAAFLVDTFFRGASFCKYVCPIGQFNFVSSLFSPTELTIRSPSVCSSCETKDCIRGNQKQRGCELDLFLPQKVGNLDCTLCMDCVKACPHDNVAIFAMSPMRDVTRDPLRSGIRRLSSRIDVSFVMLIVVLSAFLNAAAMIGPGAMLFARIGTFLPPAFQPAAGLLATCVLAAAFAALLWLLAAWMRRLLQPAGNHSAATNREIFSRFALALLPLGLGMWSAHLLFHTLTTWSSAVPLVQQFAHDLGLHTLGMPDWSSSAGMAATGQSLLAVQLFLLDAGLVLTLYAGWRLARTLINTSAAHSLRFMLPWASAVAALYIFGFWVLLQPMQMRGMMMQG
jgi:ferredoxin